MIAREPLLVVTFVDADGIAQISRIFQTIGAARRWAKWLSGFSWASNVRIMKGGAGGMEVK
jgi:hypothetical protein